MINCLYMEAKRTKPQTTVFQRAGAFPGRFLRSPGAVLQALGMLGGRFARWLRGRKPRIVPWDYAMLALLLAAAGFFLYCRGVPDGRLRVSLAADGAEHTYLSRAATAGEFLASAGVSLAAEDELSASADEPLYDGMALEVTRAFPVAVQAKNAVTLLRMTGGTVGDALSRAGVQHDADDELSALPFEDVSPGMKIVCAELEVSYAVSSKTLDYKETYIKDDTRYEDYSKIEVLGQTGVKQITQRITTRDGLEIGHEVVDQVALVEAIDEVTRIGTKIKYQTSLSGEYRRWKKAPVAGEDGWVAVKMDYITAYTSAAGKKTATGTTPRLGTIAVSPKLIPYGSQIYVKGYGFGVARDTGAFRNYTNADGSPVNQLDLWMATKGECTRYGRKYGVTVLVKYK